MVRTIVSISLLAVISLFCSLASFYEVATQHTSLFLNSLSGEKENVNYAWYLKLSQIANAVFKRITPDLRYPAYDDDTDYIEMYNRLHKKYFSKQGEPLVTLTDVVPKVAINDVVMVTFTDSSYLESFYSSYNISNLGQYHNFIVVAVDRPAYETLHQQGYPVAYFESLLPENRTSAETSYGTNDFHVKMANKMQIIRQVILLGYSVLLFDSDVVLFKDPVPSILSYKDYDIVAQKDDDLTFSFFRPTLSSLKFINMVLQYQNRWVTSDQPVIERLRELNVFPSLRWMLLPEDTFSSGLVFFSKHQFYWDEIDENQIMVHNNYVIGYENKIYRLKEMKMYMLDIGGEYSSPTARYLVLDSISCLCSYSPLYKDNTAEKELSCAVFLANELNRSLVLPLFPCGPDISLKWCNLCYTEDRRCFSSVMKNAVLPWKEHIFFENEKVPLKYRLAANNTRPIAFSPSLCNLPGLNGQPILCYSVPKRNVLQAATELLQSMDKDPVIRLHSVYHLLLPFC